MLCVYKMISIMSMNKMQFNFLILTAEGRFKTMTNMLLDNDYKRELARSGLFYHNNILRCIGCFIVVKKINSKIIKRHTFSETCITSTDLLLHNEAARKKSFVSFSMSRKKFKSKLVVDMLVRRGFYSFGKLNFIRCAKCHVVFKYINMDHAQQQHKTDCFFLNSADDNYLNGNYCCDDDVYDNDSKSILSSDLPPPKSLAIASAPYLPTSLSPSLTRAGGSASPIMAPESATASECKICFDKEKSVCFLPCRHLVACEQCSRKCKKCCVCNLKIETRILTLPQ
ncbi:Inhibitor of apoptosis 2 [Lonomia obliqua multiple nucleopolyhedrovirus]|uniref:Inhibitor of apoptosis 2 n=1 Tax=Lonomia obliqua multiple nucleopolyhedrovirus TaxID=134394 RepID=A0A126FCD4_9ABAC|nr:Inhibitor of apoptosis 2 [Lonomia obliqua multiple nucleopolyhedrovirus]AKN81048.1 Inhibitor of apoptosis 2 [Lonomia obliqua multiple nucleopolyhedrovirus]